MKIEKERQPIIQSLDAKNDVITYHLKNKQHRLPEYTTLKIDGRKVRITLKDGTVRHLPDCLAGFTLDKADAFEIVLKRKTA